MSDLQVMCVLNAVRTHAPQLSEQRIVLLVIDLVRQLLLRLVRLVGAHLALYEIHDCLLAKLHLSSPSSGGSSRSLSRSATRVRNRFTRGHLGSRYSLWTSTITHSYMTWEIPIDRPADGTATGEYAKQEGFLAAFRTLPKMHDGVAFSNWLHRNRSGRPGLVQRLVG
jgi:hypothetical protein